MATTTFSEAISRAPLRPFQLATVAICMFVLVCDGVDMQLLGLLAPLIIKDWTISRAAFGPAMSAALIGMAFGAWLGGWIGDKIGRRNSLAVAVLVFGGATIAASQVDTVMAMVAWRVIGGLAFGAAFPNSLALASEWLPERWRAAAIAALSIGTPAGSAIAAVLATSLVNAYGWRGTFVAFGIGTLGVLVLVIGVLRDSPSYFLARGNPDRAERVASKVVAGGLSLMPDPEPGGIRGQAGRRGSASVFDRDNLRLNIGIGLSFTASTMIAYALLNWATSLLTAAGLTLQQAFSTSFTLGLCSIAGALSAGLLIRLFGTRSVMALTSLSLLVLILGLAVALAYFPPGAGYGARIMVDALMGAVSGVVSVGIATIYVIMTLGYPQTCRGAGIGFGMLMGRVGGIVASYFGGALLDFGNGSTVPFFLALGVAAALVAAGWLIIDRHVPAVATPWWRRR